jgi:glycosyltransferase involved in cell wall biosynthesis
MREPVLCDEPRLTRDVMRNHWFIVPSPDGPPSGGTLYNRELLRGLSGLGFPAQRLELAAAAGVLRAGVSGVYWVDTLYLQDFELLWRANQRRSPLGLLAHYLPSLVDKGGGLQAEDLCAEERFALHHCDVALTSSQYMRHALAGLGLSVPTLVIEPGCLTQRKAEILPDAAGVRALMVANLTPGKGVAPFLAALAGELRDSDAFQLEIVGSFEADPAYAWSCVDTVQQHPVLARRVSFSGSLSPEKVSERLLRSNLLVSASRMESFGMAVAEARTAGVPVAALAKGNLSELVATDAGGVLLANDQALAETCLAFARDHSLRARAVALARSRPRPARSFDDASREFMSGVSAIGWRGSV